MLAALYSRQGPARDVLKIVERPDPIPGLGEVRVRIETSGVNPADAKTRSGAPGRVMAFPEVTPHSDGAGVIDAVGEGIPPSRIGERVWTWNAQWRRPFGTAAQYTIVPGPQAVRLPDNIDFRVGACLGIPAMTARHAVLSDGSVQGRTLLIAGGAGSVGFYAIQIAKREGARVVATVSSNEKREAALSAGADLVVSYKDEHMVEQVEAAIGKNAIDRIVEVDLAANTRLILPLLRNGGTVLVYGSASNMTPQIPVLPFGSAGVLMRFMSVYTITDADRQAGIRDLTRYLSENVLKHKIAASFSLDEIVAAHEAVESGSHIGNVVLTVR